MFAMFFVGFCLKIRHIVNDFDLVVLVQVATVVLEQRTVACEFSRFETTRN